MNETIGMSGKGGSSSSRNTGREPGSSSSGREPGPGGGPASASTSDSARGSARGSARMSGRRQAISATAFDAKKQGDELPQIHPNLQTKSEVTTTTNKTYSTASRKPGEVSAAMRAFLPPPKEEPIEEFSEEDKLMSMLGHKVLKSGKQAPYLYREDFCGACGVRHGAPHLMDMYPFCSACWNTLREPNHLRKRWEKVPNKSPLVVLVATYGDPVSPMRVVDVTPQIESLVDEYTSRDRIIVKPSYDLFKLFGSDPCPGEHKQLRIRYRIGKVHGWVSFEITPDHHAPTAIRLIAPKERYLTMLRCTWGHPRGRSTTGRMSIDVQEQLQGICDLNGGSYLIISTMQNIIHLLGDPCPGYPKDLHVEYDIAGRVGREVYPESHGHLERYARIDTTPVINPLIFVESATYGLTVSGQRERMYKLGKQLAVISAIEHRKSLGMLVQAEEIKYISKKEEIIEDRRLFKEMELAFFDVTDKMQKISDKQGGAVLRLDKKLFNAMAFGDPKPGAKKLIECSLICHGHDSERRTDSYEMTPSGFPRNLILGKNSRFNILTSADGKLEEDLIFETYNASPLIVVTKALYGHPTDLTRCIDVSAITQKFVVGRTFTIDPEINLDELFSNPCPGAKKNLVVEYVTRGFQGSIRVRERNNCLGACLELGYPPIPPREEILIRR